jgi:hypothetical protein
MPPFGFILPKTIHEFFTNTCTAPNAVRCKCKRMQARQFAEGSCPTSYPKGIRGWLAIQPFHSASLAITSSNVTFNAFASADRMSVLPLRLPVSICER